MRFGHETASFDDAVEREIRDHTTWEFLRDLQWGLWADQIARWLAVFPPDQLHIATLADFSRDQSGTFRGTLEFLGVPPWEPDRFEKFHSLPTAGEVV